MIRWEQGRAEVEVLLGNGELQRVPPSRVLADRHLTSAETKLGSAEIVLQAGDIASALGLAYDAARLALTAILANEGLRPTSSGGHLVVLQTVLAQLDPPLGDRLRPFDRMRRERNRTQYPAIDDIEPTPADVQHDIAVARDLIGLSRTVIDSMPGY